MNQKLLVLLGITLVNSAHGAESAEIKQPSAARLVNDQLILTMNPADRIRLLNLLNQMNIEVRDWSTIESDLAPSKCIGTGN